MMLTRRQWIAGGATLAAALATGCTRAMDTGAMDAAGSAMPNTVPSSRPIGIQLYTVREIFEPDPMGTLEKLAAIGYREVEYGGGGYDRMNHRELRATMDRLGLRAPSIHVGYESMRDQFDASVTMAKTLGADTIVVPYMNEPNRTASAWPATVDAMNGMGRRLREQGLGFAYHNHDFEFTEKHGGTSLFDTLLARRDRDALKIELDLYWAIAAGQDPKALIRRLAGDIYAYHVKDRTAGGQMTSVGRGVIDFADIFTLNDVAGVQHFYVENDESPAPYLPDVTTSYATLSRLFA